MILAEHHCPSCGRSSSAPFAGVIEGDAGFWCCEHCDHVFRISIDFESVEPGGRPPPQRNGDVPDAAQSRPDDESSRAETVAQRLLEFRGEILFLRDRLLQLEQEAERLQEEYDNL